MLRRESAEIVTGTEHIDAHYAELDAWPSDAMLQAMYESQVAAARAVEPALPAIARAVDEATPALQQGGRIVYVGAGTSGRIGVQDGAELVPTFSWPSDRVVFLMAGGMAALTRSAEAAEDSEDDGARAVRDAGVNVHDVVIGIAASGTTPFVLGALRAAREAQALTIGIANNSDAALLRIVRHPVLIETGSEVIAGSTRMKAGTAQKIVLNLLSTALMVKLGRVYRGLMVHMRATNAKLRRRAEGIVASLTGCAPAEAQRLVEAAEGDVKVAILLARGIAKSDAHDLLERTGGNLRLALDALGRHDD